MKKINLTLILVFLINLICAQKESNVWYFGYNAGITFNTNPPSSLPPGPIFIDEGCSSISDSSGNFLFCSDGVTVWDSNHDTMPNGTGLYGSYSSSQSCLIVPYPGNNSKYYVFTAPEMGAGNSLSFSLVDLTLNNGFGDVTNKNTPLLANSTEKVTAVYHSNGNDIWVLGHTFHSIIFYAYLITDTGINMTPVISSVGSYHGPPADQNIGCLKFSPCGDKLAAAVSYGGFLELYDFDNSTGIVSNPILLGNYSGNVPSVFGVEFSPDGSRLYASYPNGNLLTQYDLTAGSPSAIIASCDTIYYVPLGAIPATLQNGPDGQMYVARAFQNKVACIKNPNQLGAACNFTLNYITLGANSCMIGLPNFLTSYFCDLNVGVEDLNINNNEISIFPNPFTANFTITIQKQNLKHAIFTIKNILGQTVFTEQENNISNSYTKTIDLRFLSKGIYLLEVNSDEEAMVRKIVKE